MIYTSYFSKWKKVPHPISIARISPKWYDGEINEDFAPSRGLLFDWKDNKLTKKEYTERYLGELNSRGITLGNITTMIPDGCTLLCWEKPGDFCHRHILSWILNKLGIEAKEWDENEDNQSTKTS
jgi:hypothetical protein